MKRIFIVHGWDGYPEESLRFSVFFDNICNMTNQAIIKKISNLESELQKLKIEAYFSLPKNKKPNSKYPEKSVIDTIRKTRKEIWQKNYAKKT